VWLLRLGVMVVFSPAPRVKKFKLLMVGSFGLQYSLLATSWEASQGPGLSYRHSLVVIARRVV
jgi:hypothetical protein